MTGLNAAARLLALALACATPAFDRAGAQDGGAQAGNQEAVAVAAELYTLLSGDMLTEMVRLLTAQVWPPLEAGLRAKNPNIGQDTLNDLRREFERIQVEYLMEVVKDAPTLYARHFSAVELREVLAFYRTPTGAKLLQRMPQLTAEITAMIMPRLESVVQRTNEAFERLLRARGFQL